MAEPELRTCKRCCVPKPIEEYKLRGHKTGFYRLRTCDECQREADRVRTAAYIEKNKAKVREREATTKYIRYNTDSEFREKVKTAARASSQRYYEKNREAILARRRERRRRADGVSRDDG